jgi:transposase InsO family protein
MPSEANGPNLKHKSVRKRKRPDPQTSSAACYSLAEAKIVIESWRRHSNAKRPHSSLGYSPPAPEVIQWPASPSGAASPATPAVAPRSAMH